MKCPKCGTNAKSRVKETMLSDGDVVRRRECTGCSHVFGTREKHDPSTPVGKGKGKSSGSINALQKWWMRNGK